MTKCPCKGCENRTVTCHSVCRRYEDWKIERAAEKDYTRDQNMIVLSESAVRRHWRNLKYPRKAGTPKKDPL